MKTFVTLLLCIIPVSLFAQVNNEILRAMDNYDYETVITLFEPDALFFFERQHKHESFDRPCRVLQIDW